MKNLLKTEHLEVILPANISIEHLLEKLNEEYEVIFPTTDGDKLVIIKKK